MNTVTRSPRSLCRSIASVAVMAVIALTASQGTASAEEALASPTLSNQASQGWWAGIAIFDSGNLYGGVNPTGFITFKLFGPDDPTCSDTPIFTTSTRVTGNGYYASSSYVTNAAGTYRWISSYSGDDANNPTAPTPCGTASASAMVAKRHVALSGDASEVSPTGVITNTATLAKAVGPTGPTGTITWTLYGPNNMICSGAPLYTSVRNVSANGNYRTVPFTLTIPGKYSWKLVYSGDANNVGQFTTCNDPANHVTFTPTSVVTPMTLTAGPSPVDPGDALTVSWSGVTEPTAADWIGLYPVGGYSPVAWRYTGGTVSGTTIMTVPPTLPSGNYEVRLRTVSSSVVTVN